MTVDQNIIASHLATLENLKLNNGTQQQKDDAINAYYTYLSSENDFYAPLALDVSNSSAGFGQLANDMR